MREDFSVQETCGKAQFVGTAKDGSAILVLTGSRHFAPRTLAEIDKEVRFWIYTIECARKRGVFKDRLTILFDRSEMKTDKSDVKFVSYLVPILQTHYPERLSRMYVFPSNTLFAMMWGVSSMFLDAATIPKVFFLMQIFLIDSPTPIAEWVNRDELFSKYGGNVMDPFDEMAIITQDSNRTRPMIEKLWEAPEEYHQF